VDVKQIPTAASPVVASSSETRDGDKRRQKNDKGRGTPAEKKSAETFTVPSDAPVDAQISPAESQLLDSKTVVDLLRKMTTPVAQAAATFSRHLSRRKPAASKAIVEKKLNRQA